MQAGDETRRETGEPKPLLNGGEAALEVGAVEELGELEKPMAQHKHLRAKNHAIPVSALLEIMSRARDLRVIHTQTQVSQHGCTSDVQQIY